MRRRILSLAAIIVLVSVALSVSCGEGEEEPSGAPAASPTAPPTATPAAATPTPAVVLPRDEAPHADAAWEWWYYTGHLNAAGKDYGFELVLFQVAAGPGQAYRLSHFAISDEGREKFTYNQKAEKGAPLTGTDSFDLPIGDWRLAGGKGEFALKAQSDDGAYAFDLTLKEAKPASLHCEGGWQDLGELGKAYYYSYTRLNVEGTFSDGATSAPCTGIAWMDHQWGREQMSAGAGAGWDWLSIQLDDNTEIMAFVARAKGVTKGGASYVDASGAVVRLPMEGFKWTSTGTWASEKTGIIWPSGWKLAIPDQQLELEITPVMPDQELDVRQSTRNIYWEGDCKVTGTKAGKPITGRSYVELTGYEAQ